ncbi:MAG TPA: ATP-binding protein, partial [Bdellovibrionota bacterium]|nr:ATP-binding protein [Bdellovibrionota bacterium]
QPSKDLSFLYNLRRDPNFKYMMAFVITRGIGSSEIESLENIADEFLPLNEQDPLPRDFSHRVEWLLTIQKYRRELEVSRVREAVLKQKLDALLGALEDGIIITDSAGSVEGINPSAQTMLDFINIPTFYELNRALQFSFPKNFTQEKEFEIHRGDKIYHGYNASIGSLNGGTGALTVLRDVTLIRHLDQIKSDFVSLVSHELRTPLTALSNVFQILEDSLNQRPQSERDLITIGQRNSKRLRQLIDDLLDLSKMEAGKMHYQWTTTTLEPIIQNVLSSVKVLGQKKQLNFITQLPEQEHKTYIDSSRIEQVLTNLISNAIKFSPQCGNITISLSEHSHSSLPVGAQKELESFPKPKGYLHITVSDDGPGISPSDLDRLFDKFHQLEHVVTRSAQGTGLGLAIARNIVRDHAGAIWAESKIGFGTSLHLFLPSDSPEYRWFIHLQQSVQQCQLQQSPLTVIGIKPPDPSCWEEHRNKMLLLGQNVCRREKDRIYTFEGLPGIALFFPGLSLQDRKVAMDRLMEEWEKSFAKYTPKILMVTFPDEQEQFIKLINCISPEETHVPR